MANDSFTKLMNACLESKKTTSKKKAVKESKKNALVESKFNKRRFKKESDDEDKDKDDSEDLEMTTADDIVAVVDPDLDADEMTAVALGFQQLIDDAPEDSVPETDEYVGDNIYGCPICGQTFFSETPMGEGDVCLVCGKESPDGFVKVGEVEGSSNPDEDVKKDDEGEGEENADEGDFDFDGEEISVDFDEDEKDLDESKKARRVRRENRARRPVTRTVRGERRIARRPSVRSERTIARRPRSVRGENRVAGRATVRRAVRGESARLSLRRPTATRRSVRGESLRRPSIRRAVRPSVRTESRIRRPMRPTRKVEGLNLDEKTFNTYLTKFIRENYNTARSFNVVGAKKNGNNLRLECVITMKSGKKNRTVLNCNYRKGCTTMMARDNGTFKVESKNAPFMFKVSTVRNVIRCEGMKYNFITKRGAKNESKRYQVFGSYLNEGKKAVRPSRRISESRRSALRRPSIKRVNESRRATRRNIR